MKRQESDRRFMVGWWFVHPIEGYRQTMLRIVCLVTSAGAMISCQAANGIGPERGRRLYAACASCHGPTGSGNKLVGAPAIAGLPAWYVEGQLRNFQSGVRGTHPDDLEGMRMRPMSKFLVHEQDIPAVAGYVGSLPAAKSSITTDGNSVTGAASFATCMACHGATAAGNEALRAPRLSGLNDWYIVAQLKKFKAGVRGYAAADIGGLQMRPMAATLDEQAMKDVAAYITTFSAGNP